MVQALSPNPSTTQKQVDSVMLVEKSVMGYHVRPAFLFCGRMEGSFVSPG
jgi:hypothetical protein